MKHLCQAAFIALILPLQAVADTQLDRIETQWKAWAESAGVKTSTISVAKDGKVALSKGLNTKAQTVMAFASLSKAITAACTNKAVGAGVLSFSDTVGSLLGKDMDVAPTNTDITIAQLLTHGSGIAPDATQRSMQRWVGGEGVKHQQAAQTALARDVQKATRGTYAYNNENYAILGRIIEVVTGQSYETYCAQAVLTPYGITTANLTSIYGPFAAWGGWSMSADDYNRFLLGNFGPSTQLGQYPDQFPNTALNDSVNYGMGVTWREFRQGYNAWHFGLLCFGRKTSGGSFFAYYEGTLSVVVTHDKCLDWSHMRALDSAMVKGVFNS